MKNATKKNYYDTIKFKPKPDFDNLLRSIRREKVSKTPFFEIFADHDTIKRIAADNWVEKNEQGVWGNTILTDEVAKAFIEYYYRLGFDYVPLMGGIKFKMKENKVAEESEDTHARGFYTAEVVTIKNREDFENYKFPTQSEIEEAMDRLYKNACVLKRNLPDGMGIMGHTQGIFEELIYLTGYENIAYIMADDESLIGDVSNAVGEAILSVAKILSKWDEIGGYWMGEDMGFKSATILPPSYLRKYVFPWHKKVNDEFRANSKVCILHSCGNLKEIYEDIIGSGFHAKHSYEDIIEPVWSIKEKYGDRLSCLGGLDVDFVTRKSIPEIEERSRFIMEKCGGSGYAFGTGNSVADYIPPENYIAALNAARGYEE